MKNEKELQMKILEQIMEEMDDYEFDRKLKPKVMSIKVEKGGVGDLPSSIKELLGSGDNDSPPEVEEEEMSAGEMPLEHQTPMKGDEEDELDTRFARLLAKKRA